MSASNLTIYLEHLTIPIYDLGLDNSDTEVQIGTGSGLADPHIVTLVNTVKISDPAPPNLQTQVLQHYSDIPIIFWFVRKLEATATAVIRVSLPDGHPEYPTASDIDIRLALTQNPPAGGSGVE